jgi:diaminopimelate decarboxylase
MVTDQIIRENFPGSNDRLRLGGVAVDEIAQEFGTPLFVYDESVLLRQWDRLRSTFPERFAIHYSVKANPSPNLLAFFLERGAGLEIASAGELYVALEAGCEPSRILFAGPGKRPEEIEFALQAGIGEIHAESITELQRIACAARQLNRTAAVSLRVNPDGDAEGGAMRMGGKATPFGIDEEALDDALDFALATSGIEFRGIHLFAGTQLLHAGTLLNQYRKGIQIARRVAERAGRALHTLDLGGGLGVPYFSNDQALDLAAVKDGLNGLMHEVAGDPALDNTRFVIEPGRFLVAEAGVYIARVLDLKVSRGKTFAILDGGMNHHLAASGNLGQTIKRNFPVAVANKLQQAEDKQVDLVGPLCTPLDVLARSIALPHIEIGDLVAVFQSGAYARSASPLGFLSHGTPPEVMVADGEARLIRRRGAAEDYLRDVKFASQHAAAGRKG